MNHEARFHSGGIARWHVWLTGKACEGADGRPEGKDAADGGQRGARAELKRANTSADVMLSPSFAPLVAGCYPGVLEVDEPLQNIEPREIEALARTAMILTHVDRIRLGRTLPQALADGRDRPAVSAPRVAALLRTQDVEDAARQIRMMIAMIRGGIDPIKLHDGLLHWERQRKDWAAAYHLARLKAAKPADKAA